MEESQRDQVVNQLGQSIIALLQSVGTALADDGRIDIAEGAGIGGQALLFGTSLNSASRGMSADDWGEVVQEFSMRLRMS